MRKKIWFGILFLIVTVIAGIILPHVINYPDRYSGKINFSTEQEYTQFKQELIKSGSTNWNQMQVLSSAPPIIVHFDVYIPKNYNFPYGDIFNERYIIWGLFVFFYCFITAAIYVGFAQDNFRWIIEK